MVVILFRSKLTDVAGEDYVKMSEEMDAHARTFPGFVDAKSYSGDDGEQLTVVWWTDEETLNAWATDTRHRAAQEAGRRRWYQYYRIEVAQIIRVSNFDRPR